MCLQLGIDDPEKWLATAPKRVVTTWEAYWQLEPWGLTWHQHAAVMQMLEHIYLSQLVPKSGQQLPKPQKFADFMPGDWSNEQQAKPKPSDIYDQLEQFRKRVQGSF